jgi:hypothetical protein
LRATCIPIMRCYRVGGTWSPCTQKPRSKIIREWLLNEFHSFFILKKCFSRATQKRSRNKTETYVSQSRGCLFCAKPQIDKGNEAGPSLCRLRHLICDWNGDLTNREMDSFSMTRSQIRKRLLSRVIIRSRHYVRAEIVWQWSSGRAVPCFDETPCPMPMPNKWIRWARPEDSTDSMDLKRIFLQGIELKNSHCSFCHICYVKAET